MPSGIPRIPASSSTLAFSSVVHVLPSPRDRSARLQLHADWITESKRPGRPESSWIPQIAAMPSAGALEKFCMGDGR
ncbi:MAG: hypothetical protein HRT86_07920 [Ilumatobacteraceae bacterium]|nr:hypothetical protein [Ilumatobacteraceae bacterium]